MSRHIETPTLTHGIAPTRRQILQAGSGLALGGLASVIVGRPALAAPTTVVWGSASLGSTGYIIIEGLSHTVNKYAGDKVRSSTISTGGGAENLALIDRGDVQFGQTVSTDWQPAMRGDPPYGKPVHAMQMFAYVVWGMTVVVAKDSPIQTIQDLAGRRGSLGPAGGSLVPIMDAVTTEAGIKGAVNWSYTSAGERYDGFVSGAFEFFIATLLNGQRDSRIMEVESQFELRALEIPADIVSRSAQSNPGIIDFTMTPEAWPGAVTRPISAVGFSGIVGAGPGIDAELGYTITKAIFDNQEEVRAIADQLSAINPEFACRYMMLGVPVNAGAAQYFKEIGVWREELTIAG